MLISLSLLQIFAVNAEENIVNVSVVKVAFAPIYEEVPLTGTIIARRKSLISSQLDGYVTKLFVDEGVEIKAGEALIQLDNIMAKIQLDKIKASIQEANAKLKESKRQLREADRLVQQKHVAMTTYEASLANVEINQAILKRLQIELKEQQINLGRHTVYAPFNGVIAQKFIETGQWIDTSTALFELVDNDYLRIEVAVPQHYFPDVEIGTDVSMMFDALPEQSIQGKITTIIPVNDAAARTFPVRIDIKNEERIFSPGMSADVVIQLNKASHKPVLLIPRDALIKQPDGTEIVWVVKKANGLHNVMPVTVKSGRNFKDYIEVMTQHLTQENNVVVRGNELLRSGQIVNIIEVQDSRI